MQSRTPVSLYPSTPGGPYYSPYPPPKRDNLALIIVLVVVILVVLPVIAAAVLYVMVSGLIGTPRTIPTVALGPVTQSGGNATVPVAYLSENIDPTNVYILLQANYSQTYPVGMPHSGNECVLVATGGYTLCVYWTDTDGNGLLSSGDSFQLTGEFGRLPSSTVFDFYLRSPDGANLASAEWTTLPPSPLRLAFALVTDRSIYTAGDTLNVSITLTNRGNDTAVLQLPSPCSVVFIVYDDTRQVVFNSTAYWGCVQVVWNLLLEPGASQSWVYSWGLEMNNGTPVKAPGTYELVPSFVWGRLYQDNVVRTDTATIAVTP